MNNYHNITQSFIEEYSNALKNTTKKQIIEWFDSLKDRYDEEVVKEIDSRLFDSNSRSHTQIRGERLLNKYMLRYPSYISGEMKSLSDIDLLEIALRFIDLYDKDSKGFKDRLYPLFVTLVCLRSKQSIGESSIEYKFGMLSVTFSSKISFCKHNIIDFLSNDLEFDFFNNLGLVNLQDVQHSLADVHITETNDGYWHSFLVTLDESAQQSCLEMVRYWLSFTADLSRKELQDLIGPKFSERSINDALHKLIENKEVEAIGNIYSPSVRYKYISDNEVVYNF